jgi:3-keto-5-aminohexanoate cleavage enzyme
MNFFIRGQQVFFSNHRSDIERFAQEMRQRGVKPELEAYSEAMLEEAEHLIEMGLLETPVVVNMVLHTPTQGGIRGTPRNLMSMLERIERLPGMTIGVVSSMGRTQLPITTMAMTLGLNVRVGMEDNVYYRRGELVENNARLVERTVRIARELELSPASPDEARAMLGLRGRASGATPAVGGAHAG